LNFFWVTHMDGAQALSILAARQQKQGDNPVAVEPGLCPCCPGASECVFIGVEPGRGVAGGGGCAESSHDVLRAMDALELLNLLTALQGERVETYSNFNKAVDVLVSEGRVEEYPMLCGETTAIFSVISRRIIDIKEALVERGMGELSALVQSLQEKEKDKLILVAAHHLDILQKHISADDASLSSSNASMSLLPTPDVLSKISDLERDATSIVTEIIALKCELL